MDFIEELRNLSTRIDKQKDLIQTEEATKNAFVMPFINLDYINYMLVVLDDSRVKLICRLHFNSSTKYLGLIDEERKDEKVEISRIDDIYKYAEQLKAAALRHDAPAASENSEQN